VRLPQIYKAAKNVTLRVKLRDVGTAIDDNGGDDKDDGDGNGDGGNGDVDTRRAAMRRIFYTYEVADGHVDDAQTTVRRSINVLRLYRTHHYRFSVSRANTHIVCFRPCANASP
jgi:hypothetical protein